jgi:hypothetical protein
LGEVTVPSGTLAVLDPGVIALALSGELEKVPTVKVGGLPRDRRLPVIGSRADRGWSWVGVVCSDASVAQSEPVGEIVVDFARLMFCDESNDQKWVHEDSIDGLADFVFWGRDAEELAAAIGAPALDEGEYGWCDVSVEEAVRVGSAAEQAKEQHGWKLATDYRPHSHHWRALAEVRASELEAGTIAVDDLLVCVFMTGWGDGVWPVIVDRSADGEVVRVRVQFVSP